MNEPDDAAVYRLDDSRALIATTDFFPPVVDDPCAFGAIAAANAMSDVYAMGGDVLFAVNLVAWPEDLEPELLADVMRGGAEKVREAGAVIAGGHTISDKEPKYGLAVTGIVHPDHICTKGGALPGDVLILTKSLGSGVITTALKREQADPAHVRASIATMSALNREAMLAARSVGRHIHAATDITGYGLAGHVHEMAHLSGCTFELHWKQLPWMDGALKYGEAGIFAGGVARNAQYFGKWMHYTHALSVWEQRMLMDPQTSGGLLFAVAPSAENELLEALAERHQAAHTIGKARQGNAGYLDVC